MLCRANAASLAVEKEKNEIIKYMKRQVFFIYLIVEWLFYFAFEKTSYALPKWHVTITLFVPVGKVQIAVQRCSTK